MKLAAISLIALITSTSFAFAHSTKAIQSSQSAQLADIEHGRYSGQLTRREYKSLIKQQGEIADMTAAAEADGKVTKREYRAIRNAQQNADEAIALESSDRKVSFFRRWLYRTR